MEYKLWLIWLLYSGYKDINQSNLVNPHIYDYFSVVVKSGRGKTTSYNTITASHHTHTNLHYFGSERFYTKDEMLDHIIDAKF